jgi:decaprenylphospho-beta-D-erythro-pentofuranosid-2-ulose 2-reductase
LSKRPATFPSSVLILGATSAIAAATAREYVAKKVNFYLVARNGEKLQAVADDLKTRGAGTVATHVMDLDDTAAHAQMLEAAVKALGSIDVALIAHGVLGDQSEAEKDYSVAEAILRTNLLSAVSLCTLLGNYFEAQRGGVLAVISSVAGDRGRKSNYIYGTSKGALNIFLDGLRNRIDRHGVQVLTIRPGFVATPMTAHLKKSAMFADPKTIGKGIVKAIKRRKDVVYLPAIWGIIMLIVRNIPRFIFKKMNM